MDLIDFSGSFLGWRDYGGSDKKESIVYNGKNYMLKFPAALEQKNALMTSYANNVTSEYIGSHIAASIGLPVQNTLLGTYRGTLCVACEDFVKPGFSLHEFSWFMRSYYDTGQIGRVPTYNQIYDVMENNERLREISREAIGRYWDTFVVDALIGNFDRHKGNWGYLVNEERGTISLAPIYDCGSCLYPDLAEREMFNILANEQAICERIYDFPKAALNRNENPKKINKFGYYEMLSSGIDDNCTEALMRIAPMINMENIFEIIDNTPSISGTKKIFYKSMLLERKERIIDASLDKIAQRGISEKIHDDTGER